MPLRVMIKAAEKPIPDFHQMRDALGGCTVLLTMSRNVALLLLAISTLLILPIFVLAMGTFVPGIPYLGTVTLPHFTGRPSQLFLLVVLGLICAYVARKHGLHTSSSILLLIGSVTAVGALVVFLGHAKVAWDNNVSLNLLATLHPRNYWEGASPDETITYTHADEKPLKMDIYRPARLSSTPAPIVVYMHGGGWVGNGRGTQAANLRWFAEQGYLVVSPEYQLATPARPTWNTAWPQLLCAMSWIAKHARHYNADSSRIYAFGESAGGALALTTSYAAASGISSPCSHKPLRIRAVAANVPAVDLHTFYNNHDPMLGDPSREMIEQYLGGRPSEHPDRVRYVSAAHYASMQSPPTLIFLSENDRLVPIEGARVFVNHATQVGVNVRTIVFPWADHSLSVQYHSVANQTMLQLMLKHFEKNGRDTLAPG